MCIAGDFVHQASPLWVEMVDKIFCSTLPAVTWEIEDEGASEYQIELLLICVLPIPCFSSPMDADAYRRYRVLILRMQG